MLGIVVFLQDVFDRKYKNVKWKRINCYYVFIILKNKRRKSMSDLGPVWISLVLSHKT